MTTFEAEERLRREMEDGEHLLWSGVPRQGLVLRASDAAVIPFTFLWCGFALFLLRQAILFERSPLQIAWAGGFVVVGLYVVAGRFLTDAWQRSKTAYGLSDRRVVIAGGLFSPSVQSLSLDLLPGLTLTEKSDRSGTITFGQVEPVFQVRVRGSGSKTPAPPCFDGIADARDVYERIRQAQSFLKKIG